MSKLVVGFVSLGRLMEVEQGLSPLLSVRLTESESATLKAAAVVLHELMGLVEEYEIGNAAYLCEELTEKPLIPILP